MDARRTLLTLASLTSVFMFGCAALQSPAPDARQEAAQPQAEEPPEPPQIVAAPPREPAPTSERDSAAANVEPHIAEYVARIETAQAARIDRPRPTPSADHAPPLTYSQDEIEEIGPLRPFAAPPPAALAPSEPPPSAAPPGGADRVQLAAAADAPPPSNAAAPLAAPALSSAVVRVAPDPPARSAEALPPPRVNAPLSAAASTAELRDYLERLTPAENAAFGEQLDRRMLLVIAGDYAQAREPLRLVTTEQQELAARFVEALIAIREGHAGDPAQAAAAAAREIGALQSSLRQLSELSLPVVKICSAVRGFGQYDPLEPARFSAGVATELVLYTEVKDFAAERRDDGFYHTTFALRTTVVDRAGNVVLDLQDDDITDRSRNRRQDCFLPRLVRLPASLAPGSYVAKVSVTDKLGQRVAENRATFELVARP